MMKKIVKSVAAVVLGAASVAGADGKKPLAVGDNAPDFRMLGSDGKTHDLASLKGKRAIVIAWFPKAFTGG